MNEYTASQVKELKANPNVHRVYAGTMLEDTVLYRVFDNYNSGTGTLIMEKGDDVFITVDHDGSWHINFTSIYPNVYHYRVTPFGSMADDETVRISPEEL